MSVVSLTRSRAFHQHCANADYRCTESSNQRSTEGGKCQPEAPALWHLLRYVDECPTAWECGDLGRITADLTLPTAFANGRVPSVSLQDAIHSSC